MKIALLTVLAVIVAGAVFADGQSPQQERFKRRANSSSIRAMMDRAKEEKDEAEAAASTALPVPKPAVTNVDVLAVLTKSEYKTFDEAKVAQAKKVLDGEPLWLYLKFKSKLGDYVLTTRDPDDHEKLRYTMYAEIGPHGDVTALSQYTIQFNKEDLTATELKIGLAPPLFGRNKSIPVFLMASGSAKSGVWNNEVRLTNSTSFPRLPTANLAVVPVTLDLAGGAIKYKKLASEYDSIALRGTTDSSKLPVAGTFFSEPISAAVIAKLASENITPAKIYFSGDDWQEFGAGGFGQTRLRKVFATYTYRNGESCMYGVAEVIQKYDLAQSKFGESDISLQKNLPAQCADVN